MTSLDISAQRRILLVKPSSLGDIVHTLPLLSCLRRAAPQADIRWLVNSSWAPLLRGHPLLNGLIEFPREQLRGWSAPFRLLRWFGRLDWRPDVALDVQGLLRSALLARATRARRILGYSDAREGANWLHHEVADVSRKHSPHAVDRYLTMLDWLGLERPVPVDFPLPAGQEPAGAAELPASFVAIHPFSRGKDKSLSAFQVERLAHGLSLPVVVVGRATEPGLTLRPDDRNWLNRTTIPELIWVLRRAAWIVSVDSGPMHLGTALTSRVLAIHTWSDPVKVGPYSPDAWVWKANRLSQMKDLRCESWEAAAAAFPDAAVNALAELINSQLHG